MQVKTESGEVVHDGGVYVPSKRSVFPQQYPLLSGIDPYGDTIFNRQQCERLIREAEVLIAADITDEERQSLVELAGMFTLHMRRPHRYLWFSGD